MKPCYLLFHKWTKWEKLEFNTEHRYCEKCGREVRRPVKGWWRG